MASLVLGIAGEAVGGALLGSGISIFGATLSGAAIGGAIGGYLTGTLTPEAAANLVVPAILAMTLRHGISTTANAS